MFALKRFFNLIKANPGWLPAAAVISYSICYALGFSSIYLQEHSYFQASRWIYSNIPAGSKLAGPHWDDGLPSHMGPNSPGQYGQPIELPLYEADTHQNQNTVAARLAFADYLIFPTQRLQGSLLRIPEEYPQTTSLLRQLFAGQLGFSIEKTFKVQPAFGPFVFNDELADESFSVYDHPKVTIFRNRDRFNAEQIRSRIYNPPPTEVLPDMREVMLTKAFEGPPQSFELPYLLQVAVWFTVIEFIGLIVFPFIAYAMPSAPDRGFGLAKPLGLLIFGLISWYLASLGLAGTGAGSLWVLALTLLLGAHLFTHAHFGGWSSLFAKAGPHIRTVQRLWFAFVVVFLIIRSFQPEIYWGEKPMDFSFLNYFIRAESLPPDDPWAAGYTMHYYYLGVYTLAALHKLGAITPALGYNLSLVTIAAFLACSAYSIFSRVTGRLAAALLSAALMLTANLEVIWRYFTSDRRGFDLFWDSTRLFTSPAFSEYPLWSILFGDLHAHVIAFPCTLAIIALSVELFNREVKVPSRVYFVHRLLLGAAWGSLFMLNSWDLITYAGFIGLIFLIRFALPARGSRMISTLDDLVFDGFSLAIIVLIVIAPFLYTSWGRIETHYGWVQASEFNNVSQILRHLGHYLALALLSLPALLSLAALKRNSPFFFVVVTPLLSLLPFALGLASYLAEPKVIPWAILALATLVIIAGCLLAYEFSEDSALKTGGAVFIAAGILMAAAELVFLNDRMNTIFKFYNQVWYLVGTGALLCTALLIKHFRSWRWEMRRKISAYLAFTVAGALMLIALGGSLFNIGIMTSFRRIDGPRPTLDGQAYLAAQSPDELSAFRWLNRNIPGTPTMLEAQGDSYREFSRVVMHTGIPTVLGWEYHIRQRGTPAAAISQRRFDVRNFFNGPNPGFSLELARRHNAELIFVGKEERKAYSAASLEKFERNPQMFPLLFKEGEVSIYTTRYSRFARRAVPKEGQDISQQVNG